MKIKNMSYAALTISLPQNRSVILPPRGSVEISQQDFESTEVQKLFGKHAVIVLPEQAAGQQPPPADGPHA